MEMENPEGSAFVVRVYGFLLSSRREVLISYEYHFDTPMIKLPGGGLQFGEGPVDAIRRELMEELGFEMRSGVQFHTTDFFARSAFNLNHQVLGIYYLVDTDAQLENSYRNPVVHPNENGGLDFRWVTIEELKIMELTFPADRQAVQKFLDAIDTGLIRWPEKV